MWALSSYFFHLSNSHCSELLALLAAQLLVRLSEWLRAEWIKSNVIHCLICWSAHLHVSGEARTMRGVWRLVGVAPGWHRGQACLSAHRARRQPNTAPADYCFPHRGSQTGDVNAFLIACVITCLSNLCWLIKCIWVNIRGQSFLGPRRKCYEVIVKAQLEIFHIVITENHVL